MFVVSNFLLAVAKVLQVFIYFELVCVILSAILSWITPYHYYPFRQFVDGVSAIILKPLRRIIPPIGPIDITPMIAILVLTFLDIFAVRTLTDLAVMLR
ncbi:YggT family protein [Thermotoga profunda]|uniref:YggT family protein n=1 Tax=Thermotoga profunda TaxID=1508420 RepID=UPI000596FF46|nr:YggT family protein [Thermotoga profunda]